MFPVVDPGYPHGSAKRSAGLVKMHRRFGAVDEVRLKQLGIQDVVLIEPIHQPVIALRSALALHVDGGAGLTADGGIVGVGLHAEFLQRIHRGNEGDVAPCLRVGHAVELKIIGVDIISPAVGRERRCPDVGPRSHNVIVLILSDHAWRNRQQRGNVR